MIDSGHFGDGVARRTKRLWTDEEKRSICFQTTAPGVSVAQVAQRYAVNANLIFTWLRDGRYAPDPALLRVSDLLFMTDPVHAAPKGSMNDHFERNPGRTAEGCGTP